MKRLTPFKLAVFTALTLVSTLHADVLISEPFSGGAWADGSNVSNLNSSLNPSRVTYFANWFAYGLNVAGTVLTDYTSAGGPSLDTPNLSTTAGQGGGNGYLVTGNSNTSSRTFSFTATTIDRSAWSLGAITFYTKPNTNLATTQLAVEIGGSWFITTTAYTSVGGNTTWTLQTINFDPSAGVWTNLLFDPGTNTLAAGSVLATPLPSGNINAIGFYNVQNGGKVRIDTFIVNAAAIPEPSTLALAGAAVLGLAVLAIKRRRLICSLACVVVIGAPLSSASAGSVLFESFLPGGWPDNTYVAQLNAAIDRNYVPNWHSYGILDDGFTQTLFDFAETTFGTGDGPSLSTNPMGASGSAGYYVAGNAAVGITSSLAYTETPISRVGQELTNITFKLRSNSVLNTVQLAFRIDGLWYATTQIFNDPVSNNATWTGFLTFAFNSDPATWQLLDFDYDLGIMQLGAGLSESLPTGDIEAIGFYSDLTTGKIRLDVFDVNVESVPEPAVTVSLLAAVLVLAGTRVLRRAKI